MTFVRVMGGFAWAFVAVGWAIALSRGVDFNDPMVACFGAGTLSSLTSVAAGVYCAKVRVWM